MTTLRSQPIRRLATLAGVFVAATALLSTLPSATAQSSPEPHWGNYKWNNGTETVPIRAFWLFDRTGNASAHTTIKFVVDAWNAARDDHPELPFIGLVVDDANAGRCFVNNTPGWSVASACMMPKDIHGVKAIAARNPDASGHLLGAAFAISEGLGGPEQLTLVCHGFGHVMGLNDSTNEASCMFPASAADEIRWYDQDADLDAVLALYDHDENAPVTTSTTSGPTTTSCSSTTSTTSTTVVQSTTTTTTAGGLCGTIELPVVCTTTTTTEPDTTTTTEAV